MTVSGGIVPGTCDGLMFEAESQLSEGLFKNPGVLNAVVPKIKFPVIIKMID